MTTLLIHTLPDALSSTRRVSFFGIPDTDATIGQMIAGFRVRFGLHFDLSDAT
jgi:hypothetical protein